MCGVLYRMDTVLRWIAPKRRTDMFDDVLDDAPGYCVFVVPRLIHTVDVHFRQYCSWCTQILCYPEQKPTGSISECTVNLNTRNTQYARQGVMAQPSHVSLSLRFSGTVCLGVIISAIEMILGVQLAPSCSPWRGVSACFEVGMGQEMCCTTDTGGAT